MSNILISEFGLNHNGSMVTAKEMIRVSKECGATVAKGQAFLAGDVKGSMPNEFYQARQFSFSEFIELIQYGDEIGIKVFFSIFSKEYDGLRSFQKLNKFSASQSRKQPKMVESFDSFSAIVSVNGMTQLPNLKHSQILYASAYLAENPGLDYIEFLTEYYGRQVGYSDHTVGIDWCLAAHEEFGATVIEKHFTLTRDIYFGGVQFRDAIHAANPSELSQLAKRLA